MRKLFNNMELEMLQYSTDMISFKIEILSVSFNLIVRSSLYLFFSMCVFICVQAIIDLTK